MMIKRWREDCKPNGKARLCHPIHTDKEIEDYIAFIEKNLTTTLKKNMV